MLKIFTFISTILKLYSENFVRFEEEEKRLNQEPASCGQPYSFQL